MSFLNTPLLTMLGTRMSYDSERQAVLSQNLANIDTPDYRPKDLAPLEFKDLLVGGASRLPMQATSPMHITASGGFTTTFDVIQAAQDAETKPIGNAVNLEDQMTKIAQNQTDFQLSSSVYQKLIAMYRVSLGGSNS
jgi:flagellar basal-body rod protein FlgB